MLKIFQWFAVLIILSSGCSVYAMSAKRNAHIYPVYHPKQIVYVHKLHKKKRLDTKTQVLIPKKTELRSKKPKALSSVLKPVKLTINKGETRILNLSINSINRVVINSYIENVKTSKAGDVSILLQGNNAYVEFTPIIETVGTRKEVKYPTAVTSAVFTTKKGIFTLVFYPKNIPPQTIYIKQKGYDGTHKNVITKISKKGFSKFLSSVYVAVYNGRNIIGFNEKKVNTVFNTQYRQVKVVLVKKYINYSFIIYEFYIYNKTDKTISLSDTEFISLVRNPVSVSLSNEHIYKNTYTRLFIIARNSHV